MSHGLGDICAVACCDAFRGDGAIMVSPMAPIPKLGALVAKALYEPDLMLTDGVAMIVDLEGETEGWMPFTRVFDTLWNGKRHVMMGASQIDKTGNQNISAVGDWKKPKVQLLGVRGAPGNTVYHPTSYFVGRHSARVFVDSVDMVSGVGTDRGAFEIRRVITNLGVFDFRGPGGEMRLLSLHPGASIGEVNENTGFTVHTSGDIPATRLPTEAEAEQLERFDPDGRIRGTMA